MRLPSSSPPPPAPVPTEGGAGRLYKREGFPLFGKEGLGEIFGRICLSNDELLKYICIRLK
jgi:hypothetical protein